MSTGGVVTYCLVGAGGKRTYVGWTTDLARRLRQHNGEISGGAASTRAGRPWIVLCQVPRSSPQEAMRLEAQWKSESRKLRGGTPAERRRKALAKVLMA